MLTAEQIQANRKSLFDLLKIQMGLPDAQGDWSYSQVVSFNKAFAAYVLAHPDSFGTAAVQTASIVANENPAQLDDTSLSADISAFGSAVVDEAVAAGNAVGGIGRGVLTAASLAAWVIPGGLLILVGVWLFHKSKNIRAGKGIAAP